MTTRRSETLARLTRETFDIVVVGGGATGAGVARDATMRRLKVALLEQRDFGSGTSSRSSKLIHGGLRYLQHAQFRLVFEGTSERSLLIGLAPHLVRPIPFLMPTYKGRFPGLAMMDAGLWIYDALAKFRVHRHTKHRARSIAELEPQLNREKLTGGIVYYDAVTDDARLTLENVLESSELGAAALNYARVKGVQRKGGRVSAVEVEDLLGGRTVVVRGRVFVNATGPWSDDTLLQMGEAKSRRLRPTKGTHVLIDRERLPANHAVVMATHDKRITFTIPWHRRTVIGTTDTDYHGDLDRVVASGADVDYLLKTANHYFPGTKLTRGDVLSTWAGLRPLIGADAVKTSDVSREHELFTEPGGVLTITGGKLTTYRRMAREVVDEAIELLRNLGFAEDVGPCLTMRRHLRGGVGLGKTVTPESVGDKLAARADIPADVALNLALTYGARAPELLPILGRDRASQQRLDPEFAYVWAQLDYAVENEMAATVDDFLGRRVPLLLMSRDQASGVAAEVARRMGVLLGWDDATRARMLADYERIVADSRAFRSE
ncbi:MAG: glycerol-3-phosphate dehydrogenase/oxidase [Deltaproteobacteria bacterium]|nr:glycerol-3-phosphate dehydrogenase/oxidase [Deltaproteobacteria bacterium]